MTINPKLKPLFANLKRLKIGEYLSTKYFKLYTIEHDIDESWNICLNEIHKISYLNLMNPHDSEKEEEAFGYLITEFYKRNYSDFDYIMTDILIEFAEWNPIQLNFKEVYNNLKELGCSKNILLEFNQDWRAIRDTKPKVLVVEKTSSEKKTVKLDRNKVFIVHGHDEEAKTKTARFVEKLGLEAIILHERASSSKTIIEKIEKFSNIGFGIVLYTPCDVGAKQTDKLELNSRARQNVVFEHGYLIGKIGRENVCALVKGELEKPNDISGVVYITMDRSDAWQFQLAKEMKEANYDIDMNRL